VAQQPRLSAKYKILMYFEQAKIPQSIRLATKMKQKWQHKTAKSHETMRLRSKTSSGHGSVKSARSAFLLTGAMEK